MKQANLIVIGGFAGAGKSTLAARLSGKYNYPIYSTDTVNDALRVVLKKDFHEVSPMAYKVTWHLIRQQLGNGVTLILDTHMCTEQVWDSLEELHRNMPTVNILPIILQCSLETHRKRINVRGKTNKNHLNLGGDKFEDILFKYKFIEGLQRPDLIRIDANGTTDEVFAIVDRTLQTSIIT